MSKRGGLAAVLLDADQYAELIERLDYLEDSLAIGSSSWQESHTGPRSTDAKVEGVA
ncbi:MAG: hypothetical protein HY678_08275 [Chloroflexi bacterium]|nr:hypothetical protein [Chloroflexota bacterium]